MLCNYLDETHELSGPIVEIGCEMGRTTVFLNKHMDVRKDKRSYFCVDTFDGFTATDIAYEVDQGGKPESFLKRQFQSHQKDIFERTMQINSIQRVRAIQADVNEFRFDGVENISFCFIDVDLYRPVLSALSRVYERMAPGGLIAVHDCDPRQENPYRGAYRAYAEFVRGKGLPEEVQERLGVVRTA